MTSAEKIKELEAQVDGLVLKVKETEEQRAEMERRLQEQETANQDNTRDRAGTHENRFSFPYGPTYYSKATFYVWKTRHQKSRFLITGGKPTSYVIGKGDFR